MVVQARHERSAKVGHVNVVAITHESFGASRRCRVGGKLKRGAPARCGRMAMIENQRAGERKVGKVLPVANSGQRVNIDHTSRSPY